MDEVSCLIFELSPYRYAVETTAVAAVANAASLRPCSIAHACVLGEVEFEGEVVPVLDLHRLLGQTDAPTPPAGPLVILQGREGRVALAPERVPGTRMLAATGSVRMRNAGGEKPQGWKFVSRLVSIDHGLVMVLDTEALVDALRPAAVAADVPEFEFELAPAAGDEQDPERIAAALFDETPPADLIAVVVWNGCRYGVPLEQVEEFGEAAHLRRLPGCPDHIRGQAVLRGDLVTVVDVRPALGLPLPEMTMPLTLVVLQQDGERIGIAVDEVREMVTPAETHLPPAGAPPFVTARISHHRETLDILDLQELLSSEAVVVDQRR